MVRGRNNGPRDSVPDDDVTVWLPIPVGGARIADTATEDRDLFTGRRFPGIPHRYRAGLSHPADGARRRVLPEIAARHPRGRRHPRHQASGDGQRSSADHRV